MNRFLSKTELIVLGLASVLILVVLPCLNAFTPPDSAFHVSPFTLSLLGKYLCYAVLALSVDLLWGYTGLLCLGQCLFFALGGYAMGMHLMLMIGERGQYGVNLPDFMVFLDYQKIYAETGGLPPHWIPFKSFWFAAAAVLIVPGVVAFIFGVLAFRSRIKGVYFAILTQALTYAASLIFFRNEFTFGGNNGLTDFKEILGFDLNAAGTRRALFAASGVLLIGVYVFCRWLTNSRFGKIQRAIRDSENRVLFSGYSTMNFKLFVFVVSAMIASLGGALYAPQVGIINPSEMTAEKSLEAVVWVAAGGRGTLVGPILGAVGVNWLKSFATHRMAEYWPYILGGLFIVMTLYFPKGLVGIPAQVRGLFVRWKRRRRQPEANPERDADDSLPAVPDADSKIQP